MTTPDFHEGDYLDSQWVYCPADEDGHVECYDLHVPGLCWASVRHVGGLWLWLAELSAPTLKDGGYCEDPDEAKWFAMNWILNTITGQLVNGKRYYPLRKKLIATSRIGFWVGLADVAIAWLYVTWADRVQGTTAVMWACLCGGAALVITLLPIWALLRLWSGRARLED